MSTQIVAQVRDALSPANSPADFLGAEGFGRPLRGEPHRRPRCAANALSPGRGRHQSGRRRRADRPGQCPPVRRGAGGQFDLAGVSTSVMDAQRAIECSRPNSPRRLHRRGHTRLRELIVDTEGKIDDVVAFTRSSRQFHLASPRRRTTASWSCSDLAAACVGPARNPRRRKWHAAFSTPTGAGLPHRNPRRRRRTPVDGRPHEDDRGRRVAEQRDKRPAGKTAAALSKTQRTGNQQSEKGAQHGQGEIYHRAALPAAGRPAPRNCGFRSP